MSTPARGRLTGRVAIVTGASQGIGRACAQALAREGADVIAAARNAGNLAETAVTVPDRIVPQACDVRSEDDVRTLADLALERFGRLDVMVNNAGILRQSPLVDTSQELWDEIMETNVRGAFFGCKHAVRVMRASGRGGSIVNVGSINSYIGEKLHTAYVTSKGAMLMLTKNAAAECASDRIRVNMVAPGAVDTPMNHSFFETVGSRAEGEAWMASYQPLTGLLRPESVANAVVFLASDEASGMTGAQLLVDGGLLAHWDHV